MLYVCYVSQSVIFGFYILFSATLVDSSTAAGCVLTLWFVLYQYTCMFLFSVITAFVNSLTFVLTFIYLFKTPFYLPQLVYC